jgi:Holliday junction resolvase RusA-like endonuclease
LKAQKPTKVEGPYTLEIALYQTDKRKRDIDNQVKAISDLLVEHQLLDDDSFCTDLIVRRFPGETQRAEVIVRQSEREAA